MERLAFLADEHVDRAYTAALRASGYHVKDVTTGYEPGIADTDLLRMGRSETLVPLTADTDFVGLAAKTQHNGIIIYQQYGHTPGTIVEALKRIDRFLTPASFRNHVEWLENWI